MPKRIDASDGFLTEVAAFRERNRSLIATNLLREIVGRDVDPIKGPAPLNSSRVKCLPNAPPDFCLPENPSNQPCMLSRHGKQEADRASHVDATYFQRCAFQGSVHMCTGFLRHRDPKIPQQLPRPTTSTVPDRRLSRPVDDLHILANNVLPKMIDDRVASNGCADKPRRLLVGKNNAMGNNMPFGIC